MPYEACRPGPGGLGRVMAEASGLMRGKRGLILGVANNRSLAWGIARACRAQGAEVAFTYQGDALKKRVEPLAQEIGAHVFGHCDVTAPASIDAVFATAQKTWGKLDFVVHAIAFSDKKELDGRYVDLCQIDVKLPSTLKAVLAALRRHLKTFVSITLTIVTPFLGNGLCQIIVVENRTLAPKKSLFLMSRVRGTGDGGAVFVMCIRSSFAQHSRPISTQQRLPRFGVCRISGMFTSRDPIEWIRSTVLPAWRTLYQPPPSARRQSIPSDSQLCFPPHWDCCFG